jgi:IMP dehydrogenase
VKRYEAGVIRDPWTLTKEEPIARALRLMAEHNISGIPIVDRKTGVLEGLITLRDLQVREDLDEPIARRMTPRERLVTAPPRSPSQKPRESYKSIASRSSRWWTRSSACAASSP